MIQNRVVSFLAPVLLWTAAAIALLVIVAGFAHADTGAPGQPAQGRDWMLYAIFGLSVAGRILHFVAPRTKTKVDDVWDARVARLEAIITGSKLPASGTIQGKDQ